MSTFINYGASGVAESYDRTRVAMGGEVIGAMLQIHCKKLLKDIHLLDAGCGTGHYAKVLVDMGVGELHLMDACPDMLNIAKDKLKDAIKQNIVASVVEAKLPDLPFQDGIFDAVMYNHVLHHTEKVGDGKNFPMLEKILRDTKRILRPNGVLIIVNILPSTFKHSIWWTQIHPGITEVLCKRYPSAKQYFDLFAKIGFHCVSAMNFLTTPTSLMKTDYWNPEGPLNEEWRNAVNCYDLCGSVKKKEMVDIALAMSEKGTLEEFMVENDRTSERGMYTLFVCIST